MSLKVVHLSITALAGGPYRLVRALRRYTDLDVRLIDLKRWGIYPHDVVFNEGLDQAIELAEKADIIHLHNYLDLDSKTFAPIDLTELAAQGTAFLRQFRSEPNLVARVMGISVGELLDSPMPSVVIAQYPERFYPEARVVPNNLPINDTSYLPVTEPPVWDILFSPTRDRGAWEDRWNTKGTPETIRLMKQLARRTGCRTKVVSDQPLMKVLREKRRSYIVLDEMVTGSYHISGLEGVSMAKPTLAFLDERMLRVLREMSGAQTHPFINTRLEDAGKIISYLLGHPDEGAEIGQAGRRWIETHWSEEAIADQFKGIYETLLQDPSRICRQESLRLDTGPRRFFAVDLPDLIYSSRADNYFASLSWKFKGSYWVSAVYSSLRSVVTTVLSAVKSTLIQILSLVRAIVAYSGIAL